MIYLIKSGEWYKAGYATNVFKRVCQYATYNPNVEFIAYGEGDKEIESKIHLLLKESKHPYRMEWFMASREQIDFIRAKYCPNDAVEYNKSMFFTTYKDKRQLACNNMSEETRLKLSEAGRRSGAKRKIKPFKSPTKRIDVIMPSRSKAVLQYSLEGDFIAEYSTISIAARAIGKSYGMAAHIADCCRKRRLTAGGYKWTWKN